MMRKEMENEKKLSQIMKRVIVSVRQDASLDAEIVSLLEGSLDDEWINIQKVKWVQVGLKKELPKIAKWSVEKLALNLIDEGKIMKSIKDIHLDKLKVLAVKDNNIETVEELSRISFLQLEELWLDQNQIANFASLRKINCPKLRCLGISNNSQEFGLERFDSLNFPRLDSIFTYTKEERDWGYRWLLKINALSLICVQLKAFHRLESGETHAAVKKRYSFSDIF